MITTPKQLRERFPYQFAVKHPYQAFHRGWFPIFVTLCEHVDELLNEDKRGFVWTSLKEKWGSARFQFQWEPPGNTNVDAELAHDIRELVREAERATEHRCIVCGKPATINKEEAWVLALCDQHVQDRRTVANWGAWVKEHALFPPEDQ